jgi:parallel beta-helix repeat protein
MPGTHVSHAYLARLAWLGLVFMLGSAGIVVGGEFAFARPLACGDTITADITLDSDLIDCPNNGIVIGADGITLDLNGHMIDGDGMLVDPCPEDEFCDVGVLNDGHNGVRITGGTVQEFAFGAFVFSARGNVLSNLTMVDHVLSGILLVEVARTTVRGSTASRNAGPDSGVGITLFESHNDRIVGNASVNNRELGIHLILSNHNYAGRNQVHGNREGGIVLQGDRNHIVFNRVVEDGILITLFDGGRAVGNVVRRNVVRDARRAGISVDTATSIRGTLVKRNRVFSAQGDGILIGNRRTTLTRNRASRNGDLGIQAVEGVIDGGGNRAKGNGDPRQCVNIACN